MGLVINKKLINKDSGKALEELCPFGAISYRNDELQISAACRLCKMCVRNGPPGAISFEEEETAAINKDEYRGICVYADSDHGNIHKVTFELIGKALELSKVTDQPVYALLIGYQSEENVKELLSYGVNEVFVYDHEKLKDYDNERYAACFADFIEKHKPSSILVGATNTGRSLAPKVAAYFRSGLTADCTSLEMKENSDLVQIRPAFGGNIMARIVTPNSRPQFATVRYKIFDAPEKVKEIKGKATIEEVKEEWLTSHNQIIRIQDKPKETDISEADIIIAVGRGLKVREDLMMVNELADLLGGVVACSRPLAEAGWFDGKHQIGLSGKTVRPKLLITLGISGAIQFTAGMAGAETVIAVNSDPNARIFEIASYGIVGDLYDVLPELIALIKEDRKNV